MGNILDIVKYVMDEFVKPAFRWLPNQVRKVDWLRRKRRRYVKRLKKEVENITVFGTGKTIPLRDIYVKVNILADVQHYRKYSTRELESMLDKDARGLGVVQDTQDGLEAIQSNSKAIVLGKPGAGKTTFLKHIALMALEKRLKKKRLPILINLKQWSDRCQPLEDWQTLMDYIDYRFDELGLPKARLWIERLLKNGKCLLLLDGLDEVSGGIEPAIRCIESFKQRFFNNRFVLSSRLAVYERMFQDFTEIEIANFDDEQIQKFIANFLPNETAVRCWLELQEHPPIKELASIPLLLTLFCKTYGDKGKIPANRHLFYQDAFDTLLKEWDSKRGIKRDWVYKDLTLEEKKTLLAQVAALTFEANEYFIEQKKLEEYISKFLPHSNPETVKEDSHAVLLSMEAQHGLMIERAQDVYSFSHLTFQEYFIARSYASNKRKWNALIDKYLLDPRWREVFLLIAEMLDDARPFLDKIRERIREIMDDDLNAFMQKILSSLPMDKSPLAFFYRLVGIYGITRNDKLRDFIKEFMDDRESMNLTPHVDIDFNRIGELPEIPESFHAYIQASRLLFDCLQTECKISDDGRNDLLNDLFDETSFSTSEKRSPIIQSTNASQAQPKLETITIPLPNLPADAVPLTLVLIPAGEFIMGSPEDEKGRLSSEGPQHKVTIPNEFYLGKYPITQAQWETVMGTNPSTFSGHPNRPVENVSWNDCREFLKKINGMGFGKFCLPSEAEWEYASRAGISTRFYWGDDPDYEDIWNYAWFDKNSFSHTQKVGMKKPNPFGLHDMSGNVWEWCEDHWHENYKGAPEDSRAWTKNYKGNGSNRVLRGGSWSGLPWSCRSAGRGWSDPDDRGAYIGFRVVYSRT